LICDGRAYLLDAHKLDNLSGSPDLLRRYGRPGDRVSVEVVADGFRWAEGDAGDMAQRCQLPVTVWLNDARSVSGTLIVGSSGGGR